MNRSSLTPARQQETPRIKAGVLQRKCACGQHAGGGECDECRKKRKKDESGGNSLQRKLAIGRTDDPFEREADRVAEGAAERPTLRRTAAGGEGGEAPPVVAAALRSAGRPLGAGVRNFMEPRIGHDFSRVRVHTGELADRSAQAVGALAYTVGSDVVFAHGRYAPETEEGRKLLAHELTHVVQQSESVAPATVQRSPSGFFSAIFRSIFRYGFKEADIKKYLESLEKSGRIEDDFDSDLKARQVVRERNKYGPLSVKIKALLVQEMLEGATLWGDEGAIIELFRASTADERRRIVGIVGRERILKDFSFGNFRTMEAILLTPADLSDPALVARLRKLSNSDLNDYLESAADPEVRRQIAKLIQLKEITTPLGLDADVRQGGSAVLEINGAEVIFLPDTRSATVHENGGRTGVVHLDTDTPGGTLQDGLVTSVEPVPKVRITLQTSYHPTAKPDEPAGYGRGTAPGDPERSLRYHEGQHGLDFLHFLRTHPLPVFSGKVGDTQQEFQEAQRRYQEEITVYFTRAVEFTVRNTDCAGKPISAEGLQKLSLRADFCSARRQ